MVLITSSLPVARSFLLSRNNCASVSRVALGGKAKEGEEAKLEMEDVVSLCKRRGFVFQSGEIYNGYAGFYDFGEAFFNSSLLIFAHPLLILCSSLFIFCSSLHIVF